MTGEKGRILLTLNQSQVYTVISCTFISTFMAHKLVNQLQTSHNHVIYSPQLWQLIAYLWYRHPYKALRSQIEVQDNNNSPPSLAPRTWLKLISDC